MIKDKSLNEMGVDELCHELISFHEQIMKQVLNDSPRVSVEWSLKDYVKVLNRLLKETSR